MNRAFVHFILIFLLLGLSGLGAYSIKLNSELRGLSQEIGNLSQQVEDLSQQLSQFEKRMAELTPGILNAREIYEKASNSVVSIEVRTVKGEKVGGSGFLYDSNGYIITNHHVIKNAHQIKVILFDGRTIEAKVVGGDIGSDLAVLELEQRIDLPPLTFADSDSLKIGDPVVAIGSPFGLGGSITAGIVSQKGRLLPTESGFYAANVIQFDAPINPGNSGGPLLNLKGEVVGITTAILTPALVGAFVGIGFAIPSNTITKVVPALIKQGYYEHPWLGIKYIDLPPEITEILNLKIRGGVIIQEIIKGSPADKAGLRGGNRPIAVDGNPVIIGGDIIIRMNDSPINSKEDLLNSLETKSPGEIVELVIIREGKELLIRVTLGTRPKRVF